MKNFARTLHFHSPAAYEKVRSTFLKCLPAIETLNRWYSSKNYKPGICKEIITKVSQIVNNEVKNGKKLVFNITFDEMSIKQWTNYCKQSHEFQGLIDLGGQIEVDTNVKDSEEPKPEQKASKALVFMLVKINGGFKTPVAYYLTNSLTGNKKSILLNDLLLKLHENNINVISVTFDGDESNQKSCKILGANFDVNDRENFKPFFSHPATFKPVLVFLDACHMMKLIRNYFALKGPIIYNKTDIIDWKYIVKLNEKQYDEEMHCANPIKNRHINFQNEKMKLFLAVQVLSLSTYTALQFLEKEINDAEFKGASATAELCKIFNDAFDILNTKNKFCKNPGRKAVTPETLVDLERKINASIKYIENLEVNEPLRVRKNKNKNKENENASKIVLFQKKSVLKSTSVRTGFLGLIISLTNFYSLCEMLFRDKICDYVLSYKLSQDHVEMFFALIRRMNGYTNNPTTIQFKSAYKKLLLNNINIAVSKSANCKPQDDTMLITNKSDISSVDNSIKEANN